MDESVIFLMKKGFHRSPNGEVYSNGKSIVTRSSDGQRWFLKQCLNNKWQATILTNNNGSLLHLLSTTVTIGSVINETTFSIAKETLRQIYLSCTEFCLEQLEAM